MVLKLVLLAFSLARHLIKDKTKNLIPSSKLKFPATFTLPY